MPEPMMTARFKGFSGCMETGSMNRAEDNGRGNPHARNPGGPRSSGETEAFFLDDHGVYDLRGGQDGRPEANLLKPGQQWAAGGLASGTASRDVGCRECLGDAFAAHADDTDEKVYE